MGWFALILLFFMVFPLLGQGSRCADCHFANPDAPNAQHLLEWDYSAHERNGVGCDACHGGDPSTFEPFLAHQGILNSGNPASPVHRRRLPRTCGGCHIGPFVAFQKSKHFEMLEGGNDEAPTCSTCHGDVAAHLLSPKGLEARCASCHGEGKVDPQPEFAPQGRLLLEGVHEVRQTLREVPRMLERIKDPQRRQQLEAAYEQAEVPLIEAVRAGHSFVFEALEERLNTARRRAEALLEELANPTSEP